MQIIFQKFLFIAIKNYSKLLIIILVVDRARFELATSTLQMWRSTN